eukprot:scaffold152493_cov26-Tisochrysis_lutea.AAC.1
MSSKKSLLRCDPDMAARGRGELIEAARGRGTAAAESPRRARERGREGESPQREREVDQRERAREGVWRHLRPPQPLRCRAPGGRRRQTPRGRK